MSEGRGYAVGAGGAIPNRITFAELESYGRIHGFARRASRLQDFVEIIRRLDDAFMEHAADPKRVADDDDSSEG